MKRPTGMRKIAELKKFPSCKVLMSRKTPAEYLVRYQASGRPWGIHVVRMERTTITAISATAS
jgi:hypothetical protein